MLLLNGWSVSDGSSMGKKMKAPVVRRA